MRVVATTSGIVFVRGGGRSGGRREGIAVGVAAAAVAGFVGEGRGDAEEGEDADGEAAEVAEGKTAEEVEHLLAAQPLRVAGHILAGLRRGPRYRRHPPRVEHHPLFPPVSSSPSFLLPSSIYPFSSIPSSSSSSSNWASSPLVRGRCREKTVGETEPFLNRRRKRSRVTLTCFRLTWIGLYGVASGGAHDVGKCGWSRLACLWGLWEIGRMFRPNC